MHLKPAAVAAATVYPDGAGKTTPVTASVLTGDQNACLDTGAPGPPSSVGRVLSPTGYFDGMPGRVLSRPTTRQQSHTRSFSDTEETMHSQQLKQYGQGVKEDKTAVENEKRMFKLGENKLPGGRLATAAARLRREEREAREGERRAWAQRKTSTTKRRAPASSSSSSSPPPVPGGILKYSPQAVAAIPPSAGLLSGRRSENNWGGGGGRKTEEAPPAQRRGRENNSAGGGGGGDAGTAVVATSGRQKNQSDKEEDAVSRAFRRYAEDRDLDRGRRDHRGLDNRDLDSRGDGLLSQKSPSPHTPPSAISSPAQQRGTRRRQGEKQEGYGGGDRSFSKWRRREQRSLPQEDKDTVRIIFGERGSDQGGSSSGEGVNTVEIRGGDEGGGRTRPFGATAFGRGRKVGLERQKRRSERGGGWEGAWDGSRDTDTGQGQDKEEEEENAVDELERNRALRQAFDMYDLNGDGFITYLEVTAPLLHNSDRSPISPLQDLDL